MHDVDWLAARRKDARNKRMAKLRKENTIQAVHERLSVEKLPKPKITPWMVDDAGNRWRQIGDLENA